MLSSRNRNLSRRGRHRPAEAAYAVVTDFLAERDRLRSADAIIAFGGRDPWVADQAALLHREGWASWIVATGGVLFDDRRTEAEAFVERMVDAGVPAEHILVESRSLHTGENVGFALELLRDRMGDPGSVIAVAWPFAARRAAATLRRQSPGLTVVSAPDRLGPGGRRSFGPRSVRIALAELERLDRYAHAGYIEAQRIPRHVRVAGAVLHAELDRLTPAAIDPPRGGKLRSVVTSNAG